MYSNANNIDIDQLILNRSKFNNFIYTPAKEAVKELERRRKDPKLNDMVDTLIDHDLPSPLVERVRAVLFRQLATPNFETRRFIAMIRPLRLEPLFWEYYDDKFTNYNEYKHSLGKMRFYSGKGKKGGTKINRINVIDFNRYNGEKISTVLTLWDQSLIEFHHELLSSTYNKFSPETFFESSNWFRNHGESADHYYIPFLSLFIKNAVLFETFLLNESEIKFTRNVFLPAFIEVWKRTGMKPLIVALEPAPSAENEYWVCYPGSDQKTVEEKIPSIEA